jgi:ATP-dependent DNA helicase RecG
MQVVADAELSALDPDVIEHYRRLRADVNPEAEELGWPDEELLEALGATRRHNGSTRPTVAGILLFGTKKALRTYFPMMRIDYIRVPGVQWVKDPDRRFETIEIRSPLIRAVARARAAILDDLPRAFSLPSGAIQGQDIPLSIQIIRYANRLEIRNPGYSLKADDRLGEPGSETRNPKIAAVFHDIKYAETKGSGIRVMRELMAEHNLSPPVLQSDRTNNSFLALLLFHHFLNELDLEWLASFGEDGLTEDECKALVSAREVGAIDNASYRDINRGADTLAASKHLRRLCGFGLIEKRGQGSATYYVPTKKLLQGWYEIQSRESGAQSGEFPAQSGEFPAQSGEFPAQSGELPAQSGKLSGVQKSTRRSALTGLPRELAEEIRGLKARARGETLQAIVLKLCSHKDLSVAALARILRRHPDYLQERVVAPLVRMGRLEFTIPSEPTHPRQTYRTRKET